MSLLLDHTSYYNGCNSFTEPFILTFLAFQSGRKLNLMNQQAIIVSKRTVYVTSSLNLQSFQYNSIHQTNSNRLVRLQMLKLILRKKKNLISENFIIKKKFLGNINDVFFSLFRIEWHHFSF